MSTPSDLLPISEDICKARLGGFSPILQLRESKENSTLFTWLKRKFVFVGALSSLKDNELDAFGTLDSAVLSALFPAETPGHLSLSEATGLRDAVASRLRASGPLPSLCVLVFRVFRCSPNNHCAST